MTNDNEEPSAASGGSGVCPYVTGTVTRYCTLTPFTLTDAERKVLEWAIEVSDSLAECGATGTGGKESHESATLRGLLERTGGGR